MAPSPSHLLVVVVNYFCLTSFGLGTSTENIVPDSSELCRQHLINFQPNVGDVIEYRVLLDQAIAARRIRTGSREELLNLTDREPADPYAHMEGSLVLLPKCYRNETHGEKILFEAYLRNVQISCLNQNPPLHYDECRSSLGPLEAALKPFWFTQSSDAVVSEFRTPLYETDEVRAFEYGIAQLFGITPGNCSSMSAGSKNIVQIVHQDGGFHGRDPSRQMRFHSLRVHDFTFHSHGVGPERQRPFISSTSRAMYALDVHGAAKSGRVRDHHFVHTSLKLEIKDYQESTVLSRTSAMPAGLSACTSDHFLENYSNFNDVDNDTPLEFVETELSGKRAVKSKQKKQKKHIVEDRTVLRGIDITKAVTYCLDILTRVRNGISKGLVTIDEVINTVDDFRRKIFSKRKGKVYEGITLVKSIAETVDMIDNKVQDFKKAVANPKSSEGKQLVQGIKNLGLVGINLMTKQVGNAVKFFTSYVVKLLDQLKQYPPILIKNLKPLTDMIARVLQVVGPALSEVQSAGADLGKPDFAFSMLPKSFVSQITDSKAYQLIFGKDGQGGVIAKIVSIAKGDKDGISSEITKFILKTTREMADTIRETIDEKIADFEVKLRKEFNLLLHEAVTEGAPKLAKYVNQLAAISTKVKTGVAEALKKADEMRKKADDFATKIIAKCREMYLKAKEYVRIVRTHVDGVIKLLSEGKTFSAEKEYRVGLMKGWNMVGKAAATVALGAVPTPNVQTKASIGLSYEATGPEREGGIIEISMAPSASLQNTVNSHGDKKLNVVFSPKLSDLVPMMSVLGAQPIPMSTDPVKMFMKVLPLVQKRMMKALGDTGFWFPILIDFIRDHFLSLPAVQKALGGLDMRATAERLEIPGLDDLEQKARVIIQTAQQQACGASFKWAKDEDKDKGKKPTTSDAKDSKRVPSNAPSDAEEKFGIMEAFKAPFAVLDEISSALEPVWPPLKALLEAVEKSESEIPEVKDAMCSVQKKFFRGLGTVCDRINSVVALVGGKIKNLIVLLDRAGAQVDCTDLKKDAKTRLDKIVKKLTTKDDGELFVLCTYKPVLGDCLGESEESDEDSRTFMDDIFEFGQLLTDISSTEITGKEGEAAVKAFVAMVSKDKAEFMQPVKNKAACSPIVDALKPLAEIAKTSPLTKLAGVVGECRPLILQSASTVKNLISDLDKQFQRLRKLLSGGNANPDTVVTQLSNIFNEVASMARTHADTFLDKKASAECEQALQKLPGGGGTALAIFKAVKNIAPHLHTPMYRVADVANYLSTALQCGGRLIPPIKSASAIILGFIQGGKFTPEVIENAIKQLRDLFVEPLQCVKKDIVGPLEPLFAPYLKAFRTSAKGQENTEKMQSTKDYAEAVGRGVGAVRELIAAGMSLYSNLKKMIAEVQAYRKAGTAGGVPPGLSKALSASRAFKKDLAKFIGPLRELRETLQLFAMDEETLLNILRAADTTFVGLEAGCDVVMKLVLKPPSKTNALSFLEIGEVERSNRLSKSRHSGKKMNRKQSQRTLQSEHLRKNQETPKKPFSAEQLETLEGKLDKLMHVEEKIDLQTEKLDQLQESSDTMRTELHNAESGGGIGGGGGGGGKGTMSQEDKKDLKGESRKLQKKIESQQKKLKCPNTHFPMGSGPMRKLLLEKEIEILTETITVPPKSTYGVVVKIHILVHAVANIYIDGLLCDCMCTKDLILPCTELLLVGPSMNLHVIGVGSASLNFIILQVKATAAIQIGSLMAQAQLHIGRVAKDPTKLCIKDLPSSEATFGGALTAGLDAQILTGRFIADVTVLGLSVFSPQLEWDGLTWHLGSFCYEPSKTAKQLLRLTPGVCPSKAPAAFKQTLVTLETGDRHIARQAAERSCSVCHLSSLGENGEEWDWWSRWSCEYPSLRALSLAGYANMPDIVGFGQHFLEFIRDARDDIEPLLLDPSYGYFSEEAANSLESEVRSWKSGENAPRIKRLFWDACSAYDRGLKDLGENYETGGNLIKHLSAIFLCSEKVDVFGSSSMLQYSGTVFMRYALDKEFLEEHPDLKHKNSASDKPASSFEERYNLERDETQDLADHFVVGFSFSADINRGNGEETVTQLKLNIKDEVFESPGVGVSPNHKKRSGAWKIQKPDRWIGTKKNGVKIQVQLLKGPMLSEISELRKRWKTKTCQHTSDVETGKDPQEKASSAAGTGKESQEKPSAMAFLEEKMSGSLIKSRRGRAKHIVHRRRQGGMLNSKTESSRSFGTFSIFQNLFSNNKVQKKPETPLIKKTTRQFMIYESNARVFTAPDEVSERISTNSITTKYPFLDQKQIPESSKAPYLYSLPGSDNQFQITYNAAGTPGVGEVSSSCNHPWLFNESLQDLFPGGREGSQMQEEMCRRTKELVMQEPLKKGGKRSRHPIETYTHARTKAIQQLDAEPCADPDVTSWPTKRDDTLALQLALGTQQCFPCVRAPTKPRSGWKCPVVGRREGMVLAAEAQWLNSKAMNPKGKNKLYQYGEGQYVRTFLYTMGLRVENALNETYNVQQKDMTSMILCGERVSRVLRLDGSKGVFHYSALAYVMIDSPKKHYDLAQSADEDNLNLHILMLNQEFTAQDMVNGAFPDAENDGPNAFISFIDSKCDPENRLSVGVDARSIGRELLCEATGAYTLVHNEVKMAFDKLRAERNPCRINPKIKPREYASKNSNYTFFGWRLGEMAESGTKIVRTNKFCSMCQFEPLHKNENENHGKRLANWWANVVSKSTGNLRCNVNVKGESVEDQKPRLAVLNLFSEENAKGTNAWRTLDITIEHAVRKMGENSPKNSFWREVFEEQVGKTTTDIYWRDRKSMIAVCDEIGMENIPVTKVNEKDPERLMKSRPADAQLYGATVCARLGWQTNCFQILIPVEDITPLTASEAAQREANGHDIGDWNANSMLLWRGDKETNETDSRPAMKMRDGGHAYFFQVFTGAAIAGELKKVQDGDDDGINECPEIDDLQSPEASTQSHCDSVAIGSTEGYACKLITEDSDGREGLNDRVDIKRTCDDTMPTWETLEYSQRFVTKTCEDTIASGFKHSHKLAKIEEEKKKELLEDMGICCAVAGVKENPGVSKCCSLHSRMECEGAQIPAQIEAVSLPVTRDNPIETTKPGCILGDYRKTNYKYFPGMVKKVNRERRYDILYDDGDTQAIKETELAITLVKSDRGNVLKKNTRVQARYYGEKGWNHGPEKSFYKGKITKVYGNPDNPEHQSYDVLYDDGDVSKKIQRLHHLLFIKTKCLPQQKSSPPVGKDPMWIVGTKVKAKRDGLYGLGKGDWHQGTILASHKDGTYDIQYDDGKYDEKKAPYANQCAWYAIKNATAKYADIAAGFPSEVNKKKWKGTRPIKKLKCPSYAENGRGKGSRIDTGKCPEIDYWKRAL